MSIKSGDRPNHNNFRVLACYSCDGSGVWYSQHLTDYHRGEYDTVQHVCHICDGSGLLTETIKVTYEPYIQPKRWAASE